MARTADGREDPGRAGPAGSERGREGVSAQSPEPAGRGGPASPPLLDPARHRGFSERRESRGRRRGHRVAADRIHRFRIWTYSWVGAILGFAAGFALFARSVGPWSVAYPVLGAMAGWLFAYTGVSVIVALAERWATTIYMPGGEGAGPRAREYSFAESLVQRGRFEEAITAFEVAAAEHPEDPTPFLRIARVLRDRVDEPEQAVRWFRRAIRERGLEGPEEVLATREVLELCRKIRKVERALPDLARLAERRAGTGVGEWAERELEEIKKSMPRGGS